MKAHLKALLTVGIVVLAGVAVCFYMGWGFPQETNQGARAVEKLPEFTAVTIDGKKIQSSEYLGRVLIINFWASWCGPCVEEVPSLVRLSKAMGQDLRILAISNDTLKDDIEVFLKSFSEFRGPGIDIVHDGANGLTLSKMFKVFQLPESYVFDSQGRMVRKIVGSINWSSDEAIAFMKDLRKK